MKKPPHRDYTGRDPNRSRPSDQVVPSDLAPIDLTPVGEVAEEMADVVALSFGELSARDRQVVEVLSIELASRLAELHARQLAQGDGIPRRVRILEEWRVDAERWRLEVTGVRDENGRLGDIDRRLADHAELIGPPEERAKERAHHRHLGRLGLKIGAAMLAVIAIVGAGVMTVRSKYDAMVEQRAHDSAWKHSLTKDVDRLFALLGLRRTP